MQNTRFAKYNNHYASKILSRSPNPVAPRGERKL